MSQYQSFSQRTQGGQGAPQNQPSQNRGPTVTTGQSNLGKYILSDNSVQTFKLKPYKMLSFNGQL